MIYQLYGWHLLRTLRYIPKYLCFMISEDEMKQNPEKLLLVIKYCLEISDDVAMRHPDCEPIEGITIHISTPKTIIEPDYLPAIRKIRSIGRLYLHYGDTEEKCGDGLPIVVAIGKSGRNEIVDAIKLMADEEISPEKITEETIEKHLIFKHTPDFVIKTGGDHLVDFLIWQSVYSELFFSDLNWPSIRKVDLIRAFRDYQSRVRRFGA